MAESILYYLIEIFIAVYLFIKAPLYNKNKCLWAILGFFFGIFTLCIFFIRTEQKKLGWILLICILVLGLIGLLLIVGIFYFFAMLKG
ncbi:hypothetical protein M4D55_04910 [Metabacillus idriensis]|uniref:hypothetical protein n=1 Tax=Metabacillus idriensis TaxID=324768 RepID=UPI00203B84BA|nr:hypothetical protein [Metabacillus idriensis]MCM3595123.1 hypothetical protein [Metabacillus idriensis]